MKKSSLLIALFFPLFFSCTKDDDDTTPTVDTPPTNYQINGIKDFSLQRYQTVADGPTNYAMLDLGVEQMGTVQEKVSLSLSGIPAGITYHISTVSGVPDFNTEIDFYDTSGVPTLGGSYPIKLVCNGSLTGEHSYPFTITVYDVVECVYGFVGNHSVTSPCVNAGFPYTDSISKVLNTANRIMFHNFNNTGADIYADYNCDLNTLVIPAQTVNGYTYSGSGTKNSSANIITLSYTVAYTPAGTTAEITTTCSAAISL